MSCRYLRITTNIIKISRTESETLTDYWCKLKEASETNKFTIYNKLFSLDLEGMVGNNCPIPTRGKGKWELCPFREE